VTPESCLSGRRHRPSSLRNLVVPVKHTVSTGKRGGNAPSHLFRSTVYLRDSARRGQHWLQMIPRNDDQTFGFGAGHD
jgi:hypothetical protein